MKKEQIYFMAKAILRDLGKSSSSDAGGDNILPTLRYVQYYKGYGFSINSSFESSGLYSDEYVKNHINDIVIFYNDHLVFNSENDNDYLPGRWEGVLVALYDKKEVLENEEYYLKKEEERVINNIIERKISYYSNQALTSLLQDCNIIIKIKYGEIGDVHTHDLKYYTNYSIYKNKELVFDANYYGKKYDERNRKTVHECYVYQFKPGQWIQEIEQCIELSLIEGENKKNKEASEGADDYLRMLRKK